MLLGVQIFGVLFAVFMLYLVFVQFKRKEFSVAEFSFWLFFWFVFLFLDLFPRVLSPFVRTLNLNSKFSLLVILGFIFVIGLLFFSYIKIRRLENKLEVVVRRVALGKVKNEKE